MQESDGYRRSELRAIVSIGFIGIDELLRVDESNTLDKIQSTHLVVSQEACLAFGGWVFRHEVNGIWCSFATANLALKAVEVILSRLHQQLPQVRCGLHVGDVTLTPDGELLGHTLSVAKRLETQALIEEICLSHESYDRLDRNVIDLYEWSDLGDTELKGVGFIGVWKATRRLQKLMTESTQPLAEDSQIGQAAALFDFRFSSRASRRDLMRHLYKSLPKGTVQCWSRDWTRATGQLDKLLELVRPWVGHCRIAFYPLETAQNDHWSCTQSWVYTALQDGREPLLLLDARLESAIPRKLEIYMANEELRVNRFELASLQSLQELSQDPFGQELAAPYKSGVSRTPSKSTTSTIKMQVVRLTAPEEEVSQCLPVSIQLPLEVWKQVLSRAPLVQHDLPDALKQALGQEHSSSALWTVYLDIIVRRDSYGKTKNSSNLNRWQALVPGLDDAYTLLTGLTAAKKRLPAGCRLNLKLGDEMTSLDGLVATYQIGDEILGRETLLAIAEPIQPLAAPAFCKLAGGHSASFLSRPYQGWNAFPSEMDTWFFGRESLCSKVCHSLQEHPWIVLYGRTGVGKTSFLRAGLFSELAKPDDYWVWVSQWNLPSLALVGQLEVLLGAASQSSPSKAVRMAAQQIKGKLYLVFDQFEDFFGESEASERSRFTASLYSLMSSIQDEWQSWGQQVRLIFCLREDRLPAFSALEANLPGLLNCLHRIRPLSSDQARDAIQLPAVFSGIKFSESLVETLIEDLGGDAVSPNELSLCLHRLWLDYLERQQTNSERPSSVDSSSKHSRYSSGEFHDDIQKSDYWRLGGSSEILESALIDSVEHLTNCSKVGAAKHQVRESMLKILQRFAQTQSASLSKRSPYRKCSALLAEPAADSDPKGLQLLLDAGILQSAKQAGENEVRLAQDSMLNEIHNWVQNEQLSQRYAQLSLAEEHESWQTQGTSMTRERYHLIEHYRGGLVVGDSQRHLLLQTAAFLQEPVESWLENRDADFLLQLSNSPIDAEAPIQNQIRRHLLTALLRLPLTDGQVQQALNLAGRSGHPDWLDQLAEYGEHVLESRLFWQQLREKVTERFLGPEAMHEVPAGPYWFGSTDDNKKQRKLGVPRFLHASIDSEATLQQLELDGFLMDRFPVTHDLFSEFRPSHIDRYPSEVGSHPVVSVSYYDALDFAKWLGKELPSEFEWEKASRGDDGRLYPWGNEFAPEFANSRASHRRTSSSVLAHPAGASPYGCRDMAGNVWEWTCTDFGIDTPFKVQKGGSCINSCELLQCSSRREAFPDFVLELVGFRLKARKGLTPLSGRGRYPQ